MSQRACRSIVLLIGVLLVAIQPAAPQAQSAATVTTKVWKRLRSKAKTAEEFRACANWCRSQASIHQETLAQYEAELKAYNARPAGRQGPKYPPTSESIREHAEYYRRLVKHWSDLAKSYDAKASAAEASAQK